MKKIMFNDRYGLTRAVLDGSKTMTRRICKPQPLGDTMANDPAFIRDYAPYKVGEIVAVAQPYNAFYTDECDPRQFPAGRGWTNKMYVRPSLMPHQIQITDIRVERLQDITDEDCLSEGIKLYDNKYAPQCSTQIDNIIIPPYGFDDNKAMMFRNSDTPREAFASLIDRVSGKGTWQSNPHVIAYSFQLVK